MVIRLRPNDFADSFISAEWSFDVYRNAMGELELTGIVAGYFKSVEQLLFNIIRFHRDEGFKINTKNKRGNIYYTKENEDEIDSTLGSLNDFITSRKSKLAISKKVRGCLRKAIDTWTKYQRNGYFHKDNIYARDNKIEEVRSLTLYLYFLILGGLEFSDTQLKQMGIEDREKESDTAFDFEIVYSNFRQWFIQVINYDLPKSIPGLIFLLTCKDNKNEATPYLMKYFYMDEFEMGENLLDLDHIVVSHINTVVPFSWNKSDENPRTVKFQFIDLVEKFMEEETISDQIEAIILGTGKETMLLYYKYMKEYNELDSLEENEEDE